MPCSCLWRRTLPRLKWVMRTGLIQLKAMQGRQCCQSSSTKRPLMRLSGDWFDSVPRLCLLLMCLKMCLNEACIGLWVSHWQLSRKPSRLIHKMCKNAERRETLRIDALKWSLSDTWSLDVHLMTALSTHSGLRATARPTQSVQPAVLPFGRHIKPFQSSRQGGSPQAACTSSSLAQLGQRR